MLIEFVETVDVWMLSKELLAWCEMYPCMYWCYELNELLWMIWNGDRDVVSSGKEIHVLRLLGCALFEDLSRGRYPETTVTL